MTDYNQIFSNVRSGISNMSDENYEQLRVYLRNYY